MREINVAMIGEGFMGRTHSNAWSQVKKFFKPTALPVMHTTCSRNAEASRAFADLWGWKHSSTDWRATVASPEIELVDVVTPNNMHAEVCLAALAAGKSLACEKPLAGTLPEAKKMVDAARASKAKTFVWYN